MAIFASWLQETPASCGIFFVSSDPRLLEPGMLVPISPGSRHYTSDFSSNYLVRGVIKALREHGFIPEPLDRP